MWHIQCFFNERRLYIWLISLVDSIVCSNSFRLECLQIWPWRYYTSMFWPSCCCFVKSQNHINFCYYFFATETTWQKCWRLALITFSSFVQIAICFRICFVCWTFLMSPFKNCIWRKSQTFHKSPTKYTSPEIGVEHSTLVPSERCWSWYRMTHCHAKVTSRGAVWRIARWKALVVVPHDTLLGERHWMWYRMTHSQVKGTGHDTYYHVNVTGRGTVGRIARWKALVVVSYDTFSDERHWSWYRMTHCQVKGNGRGTVWYIARWKTLVVVPYDTLPGERHWSWYCMIHF